MMATPVDKDKLVRIVMIIIMTAIIKRNVMEKKCIPMIALQFIIIVNRNPYL